jgi:hypothetical protein
MALLLKKSPDLGNSSPIPRALMYVASIQTFGPSSLLELQVPSATRCRPQPTSLQVQQLTLWLTATLCD